MKLSSLFKHKAYAFNQPSDTDQDCKFAEQLLKKVKLPYPLFVTIMIFFMLQTKKEFFLS